MENDWLTYAKRLQALASTGLVYCKDPYDIERYQEIAGIAQDMLAKLFSVPLERIGELAPSARAHVTPLVDVRGAVIEDDRIMLVREGLTGRWTLPGGFAEFGFSAAENVVKEIKEEACIDVEVRQLFSIRHKAKGPFNPDARDFYKFYFLCERVSEALPKAGPEVTDVAFFGLDELPALCTDRVVAEDMARAFAFHRTPGKPAIFD